MTVDPKPGKREASERAAGDDAAGDEAEAQAGTPDEPGTVASNVAGNRRDEIDDAALYTPAEHAAADRQAISQGISFDELVARAATAVAEIALGLGRPRALVLCGPGNNGADGHVAAQLLRGRSIAVEVREWPAGANALAADLNSLVATDDPAALTIIDGLLGSGLSRPVEAALAAVFDAIAALRSRGARVIAIDVPSGLNGETGQPEPVAVSADATVTFSFLKPGHLLLPGRVLCGEVHVRPIGIPADAFDRPTLWRNNSALWTLPERGIDGHKYSAGHCLVVSGDRWHTGASRLAALAALRVGAGAVTIVGDVDALEVQAHHLTEVMLHPIDGSGDLAKFVIDRRINTIVIGPALGVTAENEDLLDAALSSHARVVADADAITIMGHDRDRWLEHTRSHGATILTPHEAEFTRLFGPEQGAFDRAVDLGHRDGKVAATRHAAAVSGAVVVHKGADTVVAAPDGRAVINTNAPPSLATAGSGDVLTGVVAGLVAQGVDLFEAACAGVWLHGDAAARGPKRLIASDLLATLRDSPR